jgi:serine phosphatase RsbU (regulator of sigma subunit)
MHFAGADDLAAVALSVAPQFDAAEIVIYLVDYGQRYLVPLTVAGAARRDAVPVDGTLAGRTFSTGRSYEAISDGDLRIWLPLLDGTQRLGVVEVLPMRPPSPQSSEAYQALAEVLAEFVVSRRLYGDAIEHARRQLPMQLATEIVWGLLPPLTFATETLVVSAILEPCYEVGGDVFDYAVNADIAHIALFDALGHGTSASMLSTLAINAYRNARRCGLDLVDTYRSIDKWVSSQYPEAFLTAIIAELDLRTGRYRRVSAGHPAEMLLRHGRLIRDLAAPTALPLGIGSTSGSPPEVVEESLEPGDYLLLYTDGVVEARSESGEFFGTDRLAGFLTRSLADQLPTAETMRRLVRAILDHQHERLQDDASALCLHWLGGGGRLDTDRP